MKLPTSFKTFLLIGGMYAASQWATLIVISRMGGTENLGRYSLALAICGPVTMFARLNMRTVQATDANNEYSFGDYALARAILTFGGFAIIAGYSIFNYSSLSTRFVLLGVALFKSIESLGDIVQGLLQKKERIIEIAGIATARSTTLIFGVLIGVYTLESFATGVLLVALAWGLIFAFYEWGKVGKDSFSWHNTGWRRSGDLIRKCFPTGLVMMLGSFTINAPVYVIEYFRGVAEVGYYSAAAYFMALGGLVSAALTQSAMAQLSVEFSNSREIYRSTLKTLLLVACALGGLAILLTSLIGRDILELFYGSDYAAHESVLFWIVVATALSFPATLLGLSLTISRSFNKELLLHVITLAIVILLAVLFVPTHGLVGGAWALAGGTAVRLMLSTVIVSLELRAG